MNQNSTNPGPRSFLELDGVTKRYGGTTALDNVSLTVREGEFFTLVGPSGCGKTTLLRLIGGFEAPSAGRIDLDGRDVSGVPPEARGVGVVFQNYALFPHMSVGENVAYGLRFTDPPAGVSKDERVSELLDLVDLGGFESRDPTELSGGQQQRVALARALAPEPRLLLLDEPMSALDAQLRERLRAQVRDIQTELGVTTLYVTHDQEEALAVSDRVAVMNAGRVEQISTPQEVYRQPTTPFVASFIGDNNLFTGRVVDAGDEVVEMDVNGRQLRVATGGRSVSAGARVTFAVRPEHLRVLGGDGKTDGEIGRESIEKTEKELDQETGTELDQETGTELDQETGTELDQETGTELDQETSGGWRSARANRLTARVVRAEFLGESTRVRLDWEGTEVTVRTVNPLDGAVMLAFDARDAHVVSVE